MRNTRDTLHRCVCVCVRTQHNQRTSNLHTNSRVMCSCALVICCTEKWLVLTLLFTDNKDPRVVQLGAPDRAWAFMRTHNRYLCEHYATQRLSLCVCVFAIAASLAMRVLRSEVEGVMHLTLYPSQRAAQYKRQKLRTSACKLLCTICVKLLAVCMCVFSFVYV